MKSRHLSLLLIAFLCIPSLQAHQIAPDWEELLRTKLNSALGSKAFSIEVLQVNTDKKELTGVGTFFKKSGITFTAAYEGDAQIGSFEAVLPENAKMSVSDGELKALAGQPLQNMLPDALSKSVYLERLQLQFSKSNKNLQQVDLYFNALKNWELLSTANLELEQVKVHIQVDQPGDKQKRSVHGTLLGMTQIAGKTLDLSAALTDRKESLQLTGATEQLAFSGSLESLLGKKWDKGLDIPMPVLDLQLSTAEITVAPYQDWMTLAANSNWGVVDLWLQKADKKDSEYVITISPPAGFRLSTIHKKLKALDGIDLGQQKIVISSADKDKKESSKIPSLSDAAAAVKKGCSLMANLDLTKLKIDHLIGLKNLIVSSPLGA
ncbi:MAG: hypothetical protein KDC44_24825, partial [Phaeodactylibacter sp.]|nr:hypothetical protein [Phaeodactylibacter sp.]